MLDSWADGWISFDGKDFFLSPTQKEKLETSSLGGLTLPLKMYLLLRQIYEANAPILLTDLQGYEQGNFKDTELGKRTRYLRRRGLITSHKIPHEVKVWRDPDGTEHPFNEPWISYNDGYTMTEDQRRLYESGKIHISKSKSMYATDQERRTARLEQTRLSAKKYRDRKKRLVVGDFSVPP
jgi:hypothetical protein